MPVLAEVGVEAFAMEHSFVRYWQKTFKPYQKSPKQFDVPGFADPILCANFLDRIPLGGTHAHFNFVGDDREIHLQALEAGYRRTHRFQLGTRSLRDWPSRPTEAQRMPLAHALMKPEFWEIIGDAFPESESILRRLLIFLPKTEAQYVTNFLEADGEPAAVVTVGVTEETALVLTGAVRKKFRGRGLTHKLVEAAAQSAIALGAREAIFWTEKEFLLKFADRVTDYTIYRR
jgi:hypothetical protein